MKLKGKNVLESYLTLLDVRYTKSFTDQYFNEHLYKFSLYGISKMLFDYGIDNGATQIPDKEQTFQKSVLPSLLNSEATLSPFIKLNPKKSLLFGKASIMFCRWPNLSSHYADNIYSLFKQKDCNNILFKGQSIEYQ